MATPITAWQSKEGKIHRTEAEAVTEDLERELGETWRELMPYGRCDYWAEALEWLQANDDRIVRYLDALAQVKAEALRAQQRELTADEKAVG